MITSLKTYPKRKNPGVSWLGKVPEHWDVRRLRNLVDMRVSSVDKHSKEGERPVRLCNYVDVYKNDHIRPNMDFMNATATIEEVDRFHLTVGDVLITKDSEAWDDIAIPALVRETVADIVCGYHLAILRPFKQYLIGEYLLRVLQSTGVQYQFHVEAKGVTRYGLSHAAIKSVWLPSPPLSEQKAIVRFLNYIDRRIQKYILSKKKLIKLLEEQKQAIINRAVTKGLNPDVRLKPSGIEWLGEIPEHWEMTRLKHCISRIQQGWSPQCDAQTASEDEWGVLKVGCVNRSDFNPDENKKLPIGLAPRPDLEVMDGDILVSRANTTDLVGMAAHVKSPRSKLILCDKLYRFRVLNQVIDSAYAVFSIRSLGSRMQIESQTNGASSSMQNIGQGVIKNLVIPLPPFEEQINIMDFISSSSQASNKAVESYHREIKLLSEYRTRIISDVVTGKIDVREIASQLLTEYEDTELPELNDALDEAIDELEAEVEEAE